MLTVPLKRALIQQVACGDPDLRKLLENEIDLIWECQDLACTDRIRYVYTQLGLIELAQVFARNKVDTATRTMQHVTTEKFLQTAIRNMDAEATATGSSCIWTAAVSQQHFVRDSTEDQVAFNELNFQRTAQRTEDGYDRSSRNTTGSGSSMTRVIHLLDGLGGNSLTPNGGQESRFSSRITNASGGTGGLVPLTGVTWPNPVSFSATPPYITTGPENVPTLLHYDEDPCPSIPPDTRPEEVFCDRNTSNFIPSMGYGYSGRFNISLGIPGVAALQASFERGKNERVYFTCSATTVRGSDSVHGVRDELTDIHITALPEDNFSNSNESSSIIHLVRKNGTSTRRGSESIDSEDTMRGYSDGNAHSDSERTSQGNGFQQRRAESLTTARTQGSTVRTDRLTDDEVRRAYGQISKHLAELWKRINKNLIVLESQFAAVAYGASMCCPPRKAPCCPSLLGRYL